MKMNPFEILDLLDESNIRKRCGKGRCSRFIDGEPNDGMLCSAQVAILMVQASRDVRSKDLQSCEELIDPSIQKDMNDSVANSLFEAGRSAGMAAESCQIHLSGQTALVDANKIEVIIASARSSSSDICDLPMRVMDGHSFT